MAELTSEAQPLKSEANQNTSLQVLVSGVLVGLTALIPHEITRQVCAIAAPAIGHFGVSIGRVYYNEWIEDRKDESGIRRVKRYEKEIRKKLRQKSISKAERLALETNLRKAEEAIHQFNMEGFISAPTLPES